MSMSGVTALKPVAGKGQTVAFGASSARTPNPVGTGVFNVRIYADQDCYVAYGDASVVATDKDEYWPAGLVEYKPVSPGMHIAVLQVTQAGNLHVIDETR